MTAQTKTIKDDYVKLQRNIRRSTEVMTNTTAASKELAAKAGKNF